ncbi:hypothetical protein OF897_01575 [Chryseobacterium formosus]|uniref:DUF4890 domain-containing protein n=1 Tax=Chryseobacterium formosus TaxID=1537363 RepID=A0ABT3XN95_9FLAO|nr:hypothetical protein [Chryseobacterium formosus]MCX8522612.1 hypothetical protein [Chryseobacterium formosus]
MKKLVLVASLFIAFATDAQQRKQDVRNDRNDRTEIYQTQGNFSGLRLTQAQQRRIDALSKERLSQKAYDARIKKILTREQYAKYISNDFKHDKKVSMRNPARR